jgi:hypothetical protein
VQKFQRESFYLLKFPPFILAVALNGCETWSLKGRLTVGYEYSSIGRGKDIWVAGGNSTLEKFHNAELYGFETSKFIFYVIG